jgi:hypothetical protein
LFEEISCCRSRPWFFLKNFCLNFIALSTPRSENSRIKPALIAILVIKHAENESKDQQHGIFLWISNIQASVLNWNLELLNYTLFKFSGQVVYYYEEHNILYYLLLFHVASHFLNGQASDAFSI